MEVEFFEEDVICHHCEELTRGIVEQHSAQIICSVCADVIFDARGIGGGSVFMLTLEDESVH